MLTKFAVRPVQKDSRQPRFDLGRQYPIEMLNEVREDFKACGFKVRTFYRGPRFPRTPYQRYHNACDCLKEDAVGFIILFNGFKEI